MVSFDLPVIGIAFQFDNPMMEKRGLEDHHPNQNEYDRERDADGEPFFALWKKSFHIYFPNAQKKF